MSSFKNLIDLIEDQDLIRIINKLNDKKLHLLPTTIDQSLSSEIKALDLSNHSNEARGCIKAGLLEWNDDIHASHDICQDIYSKTGSYWHGIMHRREPDYGNAKYWYYKFPEYPTFDQLLSFALNQDDVGDEEIISFKESLGSSWDPFNFIDLCNKAECAKNDNLSAFCEAIQKEEIILLLSHSITL